MQASVAVAVPKTTVSGQVMVALAGQLNAGGVVSSVHVQVLEQVDEFKHTSVAVQVIVRERPHALVLTMLPAEQVTVGVLHASVAEGAV